jgi:hypothetical protein
MDDYIKKLAKKYQYNNWPQISQTNPTNRPTPLNINHPANFKLISSEGIRGMPLSYRNFYISLDDTQKRISLEVYTLNGAKAAREFLLILLSSISGPILKKVESGILNQSAIGFRSHDLPTSLIIAAEANTCWQLRSLGETKIDLSQILQTMLKS